MTPTDVFCGTALIVVYRTFGVCFFVFLLGFGWCCWLVGACWGVKRNPGPRWVESVAWVVYWSDR